MRGLMRASGVAALLAATLSLSGCASMFGGYDLAPNGLTKEEDALRRALAFEAPEAYQEVIEGERPLPDDDLLRLLYAGTAGRYAGRFQESSRLFDLASYLAEDRVTFSVSRQALSMITSDRTLDYEPGRTERLMIHYMAALNYLEAGDPEGAAVEARRIEALLDAMDAEVRPEDWSEESRFLHYFAATALEAAGDYGAADVAYRRAGAMRAALEAGHAAAGLPSSDSAGDVIVLVERGFVPHRVEQSVVIVLPPQQVRMLTEGSGGERAFAAAEAAARILISAVHLYGDRSGYYHDDGYRRDIRLDPWQGDPCPAATRGESGTRVAQVGGRGGGHDDDYRERCRAVETGDDSPYLLRISWPVLFQEPAPPPPLRVRAGDLGVDASARFDVAGAARGDFEAQRTEMLARTVLRAAAKMALSSSVEESVSRRDEGAGQLLGILANIGTLLTERADTRSWHLLPASVSMARLRLPPGTHQLTLELDRSRDGAARTFQVGTVEVRPGETTFITTRLWR